MDCRVYGGDESQGGGMEEGKVADAGKKATTTFTPLRTIRRV